MPDNAPEISLVLTTCSRARLLRGALETLFSQTLLSTVSAELVVVDDQSSDETPTLLAELARTAPIPVTVLQGSKQGVAAARNLAASGARGTWLATIDDDELAAPHWLETLYRTALEHGADCVGGATLLSLPPGRSLDEVGPRARRLLGEFAPTGAARPYAAAELPATNNVLYRRSVFEALGSYDTSFTEGGEDTDFFERMRNAGYKLWLTPEATVQHLIPPARMELRSQCLTAMRVGTIEARLQQRRRRWLGPLKTAAVRLGVAALRDLPNLSLATAAKDNVAKLDARLSLCFTAGLLRALPSLRGGRSRFLEKMDFRMRHGERNDPTAR